MPRITAPTVAENRELRRDALLTAAATLMQRGGSFTMELSHYAAMPPHEQARVLAEIKVAQS